MTLVRRHRQPRRVRHPRLRCSAAPTSTADGRCRAPRLVARMLEIDGRAGNIDACAGSAAGIPHDMVGGLERGSGFCFDVNLNQLKSAEAHVRVEWSVVCSRTGKRLGR